MDPEMNLPAVYGMQFFQPPGHYKYVTCCHGLFTLTTAIQDWAIVHTFNPTWQQLLPF